MQIQLNNYAFIDSQNLNLSVRSQGWKLDYKRFRVYLKEKYGVTKAFMFIGFLDGNNELYQRLQEAGFICIFKPTLTYRNGTTKGNCDAELVLHAMIEFANYDKAILVTGDGDFYCLVQYWIIYEKLERILIPNINKYSALLKRFGKKRLSFMNNLRVKLEYHSACNSSVARVTNKKDPSGDGTLKGTFRGDLRIVAPPQNQSSTQNCTAVDSKKMQKTAKTEL